MNTMSSEQQAVINDKKSKTRTRKIESKNDLLNEYDFTGGIRGKYTQRYASGTNIKVLVQDVAKVFSGSKSVNRILRAIARNMRRVA